MVDEVWCFDVIGLLRQMKCCVLIPPNSWYLFSLYLMDCHPEWSRGTRVMVFIVSVKLSVSYRMVPVPVLTIRVTPFVLKSVPTKVLQSLPFFC